MHLLFVVWQDTAHKVRIGVVQRLHQPDKLLFVRLRDGSEHALACPHSNKHRGLGPNRRTDADNLR